VEWQSAAGLGRSGEGVAKATEGKGLTIPAAILFDIDGTLLDDGRATFLALRSFHAVHGEELGLSLDGLAARWRGLTQLHFARYLAGEISMQEQRRARIQELFASSRPGLNAAEADDLFATYLSSYRASWTAYPDAQPTVSALSLSGVGLAVLSNGDRGQQIEKLQKCGLDTYFSEIMTSSEIGWAKPAPEAFLGACRRLGISPRRCVYVGDAMETDACASAAAGLIGVWLDRAGSGIDPGPGVQVIHGLGEIVGIVGDAG
jgi:putative hydrolase of the HAD superfamily